MTRPLIGIGVDRLDYTKGIPERLNALDCLFTRRPELRTQLTFVQIAVPSRSKLESYQAVEADIDQRVGAINARHAGDGLTGGPVRYRKSALRIRRLVALYRLADFCLVSSLHDGMNLVAKEFVAAREDVEGVLVLSELAGAAQELGDDAVLINPYDVEGFADGLEQALDMLPDERHRRMRALRRVVAGMRCVPVGVEHPRRARSSRPPVVAAPAARHGPCRAAGRCGAADPSRGRRSVVSTQESTVL